MSFGLQIDGAVDAAELPAQVATPLGYLVKPEELLNARVEFASFAAFLDVYSDYSRPLFDGPGLRFPGTTSYPDSTGLGVGLGLERDVGVLAIRMDIEVSGVRVFPSCSIVVSTGNEISSRILVGTVTDEGESASISFSPSTLVIFENTGVLDLQKIEFFVAERQVDFAVFPLLQSSMTLPYLKSEHNSLLVERKGGLQISEANLFTVVVGGVSGLASKSITNLSVEQDYVNELKLYDSMLKNCNAIFPLLSTIERTALKHQAAVRKAILDFNSEPAIPGVCHVNSTIVEEGEGEQLYFNSSPAPAEFTLVAGVTYSFSPVLLEIDGIELSEVTMIAGSSAIYGKNGLKIGVFLCVPQNPQELFELPAAFMSQTPLDDVLADVSELNSSLPNLSSVRTPNNGNTITHVAFVNADGSERSSEQSIFICGEFVDVSLYFSGDTAGSSIILIDGVAVSEVQFDAGIRYDILNIQLPDEPGVHSLSSTHGSNVLFRVSARSIVHPPVHPTYYTSGQLSGDTRSSADLLFLAEHPNFDKVPELSLTCDSSDSLFVNIPDVVFADEDFHCTHALFARHGIVDLKNDDVSMDAIGCEWEYTSIPWLACLNVTKGCAFLAGISPNLDNLSLYWHPPPEPTSRATILHGTSRLMYDGGELIMVRAGGAYKTNGLVLRNAFNHICFTTNEFIVNGAPQPTEVVVTDSGGLITTGFVVGACSEIDLRPALAPSLVPVELRDFCLDRAVESQVVLTHLQIVTGFEMYGSNGEVIHWAAHETDGIRQVFRTSASTLPAVITGLNLGSDVSGLRLQFHSAGSIRGICTYNHRIPATVIRRGAANHDSVIDFATKTVTAQCLNEEQSLIRSNRYVQSSSTVSGQAAWLESESVSSFYVTPASLILLSTSQETPYSLTQSLLLLFNRRIQVFELDDTTLFTISGSDNTIMTIPAKNCTLLSSQISIPNAALSLSVSTTYTIHLDAGRLVQFEGQVPCLQANVTFTTL